MQVDQYPPLTASRSRDGGRPPPCTLRLGCPDCWVTLRNRIFSALATAATCPPPPTCLFFQAGSSRTCTSHLCSAGNRGILSPLFESISPTVVKIPATSFLIWPTCAWLRRQSRWTIATAAAMRWGIRYGRRALHPRYGRRVLHPPQMAWIQNKIRTVVEIERHRKLSKT